MNPYGAPPLAPRPSGFPAWVILIVVLSVALVCGGGFYAIHAANRATVDAMQVMSQQAVDDFSNLPEVSEKVAWHGDVLSMNVTIKPQAKLKDFEITQLLLDNYLPDRKIPIEIGDVDPKKPINLTVTYPGFDSRGGKYAKLDLEYGFRPDRPTKSVVQREGEDPVMIPSEGTFTSGMNDDIYIPLRGDAKRK